MRAGVQEGDRIVKVSTPGPPPHRCRPPRPSLTPFLSSSPLFSSPRQVNGMMVTNSSHLEVVKLIKCEYGRGLWRRWGGRRTDTTGVAQPLMGTVCPTAGKTGP